MWPFAASVFEAWLLSQVASEKVHDWHELDGLQTLSDACARLEAEHKCSRFRTWRENNHGNLAEQITWIKRRVKLLAEVSLLAWMFQ